MNKKKVLLAVCGATPQILTETIYELTKRDEPFIPDEIQVITTSRGNKFFESGLNGPDKVWEAFIKTYNIPVPFSDIIRNVIADDHGNELADISTSEANDIAFQFILDVVRDLGAREDTFIHASIAGGRKTMSVFLDRGMTFYGRYDDELSHVLVNEPYEQIRDFYYPDQVDIQSWGISDPKTGQKTVHKASEAKVALSIVPYVPLRGKIPHNLPRYVSTEHISAIIREWFKAENTADIQYIPSTGQYSRDGDTWSTLIVDENKKLQPRQLALYYFLVLRSQLSLKGMIADNPGLTEKNHQTFINSFELFLEAFTAPENKNHLECSRGTFQAFLGWEDFKKNLRSHVTHINAALNNAMLTGHAIQTSKQRKSCDFIYTLANAGRITIVNGCQEAEQVALGAKGYHDLYS